jgi:polyhydroxyalkanoate synthase
MADKGKTTAGKDGAETGSSPADAYIVKNPEAFARNVARMLEGLGKAASAWVEPREKGEVVDTVSEPMADMVKTFSKVGEYWLSDPKRALEAQTSLLTGYFDMWSQSVKRMSGEDDSPRPKTGDKRFSDPDWESNPFFEFLKNAYFITSDWANKLVDDSEGLDEHTRHKAAFYVRQITSALSPANFLATNPELYKEMVASNGENLVKGMQMLAEDIAAGKGELRLRQSDASKFKVGENVAVSPGKVIAQNEVCQIIQYEPSTETVLKRPLLIVPPWINKFYILDLNPKKSFIKWAVDQGHTVFVISWVNPDQRHATKDWEAYSREGISFALDTVEKATGEREVNAIGYCVGGTLLAATLALHAQEKDSRIATATFFTTQTDFTYAGDLKVFVDEAQIASIESAMQKNGYLDGSKMANSVQHVASVRPDLALCRQQLPQGQGSDALRPALLEFGCDPHACGQSLLLPAQLLSREQPVPGQDGAGRQDVETWGHQDPDLQSGRKGRSHRPCPLRLYRRQAVWRRCHLCHGRIRSHRRRRQSAGSWQVPVLVGRPAECRVRRLGSRRPGNARFLVAALAQLDPRGLR